MMVETQQPTVRPADRPRQWEHITLGPNRTEWNSYHALVEFCLEFGPPRCFVDWPVPLLREYLLWHMRARTLVWVCEPMDLRDKYRERPVLGVGIIWPTTLARIEEATRMGTCVFDWDAARTERADAIYICEVIARPGADRRAWVKLIARDLWVRFPQGRGLPLFYHRRRQDGQWATKRLDGKLTRWAGLPETKEELWQA